MRTRDVNTSTFPLLTPYFLVIGKNLCKDFYEVPLYTHNFTVSSRMDHKSSNFFKAKTRSRAPLRFPRIFQYCKLSSEELLFFISCIFRMGNLIW